MKKLEGSVGRGGYLCLLDAGSLDKMCSLRTSYNCCFVIAPQFFLLSYRITKSPNLDTYDHRSLKTRHPVQNRVATATYRISIMNNALFFVVDPGFAFTLINISSTVLLISRRRP